jgi:molybdenum cofactor cytidylyltransferase
LTAPVAVVPAAGRSRRMGRPKLLLPYRGSTVAGALVAALRGGGVERVVLVTASGGGALARWGRSAGLAVAINPDPAHGMLSSVRAGIAAAGGAAALADGGGPLLVAPADLPALQAETVAFLLARFAEAGAPLAVPTHAGRRGHPLLVAPGLLAEIETLDPDVGLRQLLDRHAGELLEVAVDDPGVVRDVDTPEDYRRLAGSE